MDFKSLQDAQRHLQSFSNPVERMVAEMGLFLGALATPAPRKHIVVLLHGMNTNAEWQEALAEPLRNEANIEPVVVGYGNLHPVKFFIPLLFRIGRIKKVRTDLLGIRKRLPEADISVVAHSFGTYILTNILATEPGLKLHRILLCGAIVDTDYDWSAVEQRICAPVINDIGRWDYYPSLAKSWSWGFGDSGCIGFQNSLVRDRYFEYGHSDFLNVKHMQKYWLPYLLDGRVVSSPYSVIRDVMGFKERAIRAYSWLYLILTLMSGWVLCRWVVLPIFRHVFVP